MISATRGQVACASRVRQQALRCAAPQASSVKACVVAAHGSQLNALPSTSYAPLLKSVPSSRPIGQASRATVAAAATAQAAPLGTDVDVSKSATEILQYAINFARVSETYEAHSWMILLGVLKQEECRASKILKDMGLEDLYGAWHEVLWALNVSNGLEPRAYVPEIRFADRAFRILTGASNFAIWGGRTKVQSEDILMALAAGNVLTGLFPDLSLTFDHVRKAAAKHGIHYELPDDNPEDKPVAEEDNFL